MLSCWTFMCVCVFSATEAGQKRRKEDMPVFEQAENVDNPLRCPVKLYEFYLSKWSVLLAWIKRCFLRSTHHTPLFSIVVCLGLLPSSSCSFRSTWSLLPPFFLHIFSRCYWVIIFHVSIAALVWQCCHFSKCIKASFILFCREKLIRIHQWKNSESYYFSVAAF